MVRVEKGAREEREAKGENRSGEGGDSKSRGKRRRKEWQGENKGEEGEKVKKR